jgi:hypothetical protein
VFSGNRPLAPRIARVIDLAMGKRGADLPRPGRQPEFGSHVTCIVVAFIACGAW